MREIGNNGGTRIQLQPGQRPSAWGTRSTGGHQQERADPFPAALAEIEAAFSRLKTLLAFDGEKGPRDGVPQRGFYLNILV
ncbi:MAG: hypothetical protein RIM33_14250 [Alphaproteobacteria bacterium]